MKLVDEVEGGRVVRVSTATELTVKHRVSRRFLCSPLSYTVSSVAVLTLTTSTPSISATSKYELIKFKGYIPVKSDKNVCVRCYLKEGVKISKRKAGRIYDKN